MFARFIAASVASALVDNVVFWLGYRWTGLILISQATARVVSIFVNYLLARRVVFRSGASHSLAFPRYLALAVANVGIAWVGIRLLAASTSFGVLPSKIAVETLLFVVNFAVQRRSIFVR